MSNFPTSEPHETRRYTDAITTGQLGLDRPIAFMSPYQRVKLFQEVVAPMKAQLVRLHANEVQPRMLVKLNLDGSLAVDTLERLPLTGDAAELEALLLAEIERVRSQILGGLE